MSPQEREALRSKFYERTGYGPSDVLSLSYATKMFLTRNGGVYQFRGEKLIHLKGPSADASFRL